MTSTASPGAPSPGLLATAASVWPLLFGIAFLMLANGLQGSLLGVRAQSEGFDPAVTGLITSGFFAGFLLGSWWTPRGVAVVGHVRVFAAMTAVSSAAILLHPVFVDPWAWGVLRFLTGVSYAGVFVVAESWLNDAAPEGGRGGVLALYMGVSFGGMGAGQGLLTLGSVDGSVLFILVSVLISVAVVPLLLSAGGAPEATSAKPVSFRRLFSASPLGATGVFIAGLVNGAIFGMGAVYARSIGYSLAETATFMALLIAGAAALQMPIGRLSDRFDRRVVITVVCAAACAVALVAMEVRTLDGWAAKALVALFGGLALSLHSLALAYTNDYLSRDEMIGASGQLVLLLGIGSVIGPIAVGWLLLVAGPSGFHLLLACCHGGLALFALWRMTVRATPPEDEQVAYTPVPLQGVEIAASTAEEAVAVDEMAGEDSSESR